MSEKFDSLYQTAKYAKFGLDDDYIGDSTVEAQVVIDMYEALSASQAREAALKRKNAELTRKLAAHYAQRQRLQRLLVEMRYDEACEEFNNKDGEAELRKLLEDSKVPEEVLIEIVTQAHMAGQFNQSQRDPSYYEARVYYGQKQLEIRAALAQPKEPKQ